MMCTKGKISNEDVDHVYLIERVYKELIVMCLEERIRNKLTMMYMGETVTS